MSERPFEFLGDLMQRYFGPAVGSCPLMHRAELERLLTDDGQRRLNHARGAAIDWASTDTHSTAEVTAERLMITPRGLLYAAELSTGSRRTRYYLATAPVLFEPIVDRVQVTRLSPSAAAAVDSRFGSDLVFPWPLDRPLRRMLDADEVLRLGQPRQRRSG